VYHVFAIAHKVSMGGVNRAAWACACFVGSWFVDSDLGVSITNCSLTTV